MRVPFRSLFIVTGSVAKARKSVGITTDRGHEMLQPGDMLSLDAVVFGLPVRELVNKSLDVERDVGGTYHVVSVAS